MSVTIVMDDEEFNKLNRGDAIYVSINTIGTVLQKPTINNPRILVAISSTQFVSKTDIKSRKY